MSEVNEYVSRVGNPCNRRMSRPNRRCPQRSASAIVVVRPANRTAPSARRIATSTVCLRLDSTEVTGLIARCDETLGGRPLNAQVLRGCVEAITNSKCPCGPDDKSPVDVE